MVVAPRAKIVDLDRVQAALDGDLDAMEHVIAAWLPTLYGWCARLGGDRIDAEEAAHDVVMTLVRRAHTLEVPKQLAPWLFAACQRVVANHRRRVWFRRWVPGVRLEDRVAPERADAGIDEQDRRGRVDRVLDQLRPVHREVLVLCYLEERSVAEAAVLLAVPEGTVKSRLFKARAAFRARYDREAP